MEDERLKILNMLQSGQISAQQAAALLAALKPEGEQLAADVEAAPPSAGATEGPEGRWARFWIYPLLAGGGILILGSLIMALLSATGAAWGWRVFCGWLPLAFGALVMLLAWWSRRAKWLHVRVKEPGGHKVAISFPLPLTLAAWVLRIVQPFVPQLKETGVDDLIIALRDNPHGEPIAIHVDEDEGEQVQVYIG